MLKHRLPVEVYQVLAYRIKDKGLFMVACAVAGNVRNYKVKTENPV
jgi:hypothetical protein